MDDKAGRKFSLVIYDFSTDTKWKTASSNIIFRSSKQGVVINLRCPGKYVESVDFT